MKYVSDFNRDLRKYGKIDSTIAEWWGGKFGYKWRHVSEGTSGGYCLSEIIGF